MSGCVSVHLPKTTGGGNDQRTKCLETRLSISSSQHLGESEREIEREREREREKEREREEERRQETTLLCRTTSRTRGGGQ